MSEKIIKRSGDPDKRLQSGKVLAQVGVLKQEYNLCKQQLEKVEDLYDYEKRKLANVKSALDEVVLKLSQVQEQIDCDPLPEGAQPKARIQQRDVLQLQVAQLEVALQAQQNTTDAAFTTVAEAERKQFQADKDLNKYVNSLEDSQLAVGVQIELDKERSKRLAKLEAHRAKRWEAEQQAAINARADQVQKLTSLATEQIGTAAASHKTAVRRLKESQDHTKVVSEKLKEVKEKHHAERTEAVLELKANSNAAAAEVATLAAKTVRKREAAAKELADEKDAILAKGLNPYIEFRKRDLDQEAQRRERAMKEAVEENKGSLGDRLIREEEFRIKEDIDTRRAKAYEKEHRESQGRHVIEDRNMRYITSVALGGKEILDPTGRIARIDPSQVTEIADHAVGLGRSQRIPEAQYHQITGKLRDKLHIDPDNFGEYQRLVNNQLSPEARRATASQNQHKTLPPPPVEGSDDADLRVRDQQVAALAELADRTGALPGSDLAATIVNIKGNEEEKAKLLQLVEESVAASSAFAAGAGGAKAPNGGLFEEKSPKYKPVELSKFELDSMTRARERQKDRLEQGTEQVAGGRVFKGQSFVSKPAELIFKDFEVGKKYRKVFTLTNASYTFNSFKLLNLTDDVVDFFVITYEKPGRMSAGVSCSIEIVFTPQIPQDIITSVRFQTETGPVAVPLKCLVKRCAPRALVTSVEFGPMIMGEQATATIKIVNTEALPSAFTVTRLPSLANSRQQSRRSILSNNNAEVAASTGDIIEGDNTEVVVTEGGELLAADETSGGDIAGDAEIVAESIADEEDDGGGIVGEDISSEPALNEAELSARVRRVMTRVFRRKKTADPIPFSFPVMTGVVNGYDSVTLEVRCAPLALGALLERFSVLFDGVDPASKTVDENGDLITKEQIITVSCTCEDVSVYVAEVTSDFKCTFFDRIYRKRLELRNRGKNSYRVNIKIPSPINKFVEVSPNMAFVQAHGVQVVNIKFTPSPNALHELSQFLMLHEGFEQAGLLQIPIEIQVVNQELPVYFVLRSDICSSLFRLSTHALHFGKIYVNQESRLPLTVTNISMLPQKVAFVRLKRELAVEPNGGFAVLLPNESLTFDVSFAPQSAVASDNLELCLLSSVNDKYAIKVHAEGIESPFEISHPSVIMRTTCAGERVVESVYFRNTTQARQCFEIVPPAVAFSWLKVSPTVADLGPGESCRVEIEFTPPVNVQELDPIEWHENAVKSSSEDGGGGGGSNGASISVSPFDEQSWKMDSGWVFAEGMFGQLQWVKPGAGTRTVATGSAPESVGQLEGGNDGNSNVIEAAVGDDLEVLPEDLPEDEWGVAAKWRLPVFIQPPKRVSSASSGAHNNSSRPPPLFLRVETAVTPPQVEASSKLLDFGQIAIGTRQIKTVKIYNRGYEPFCMESGCINAVGPYMVLNTVRTIAPGASVTLIVECLPQRPGLVTEILELHNSDAQGGHRVRIVLRSQAVMPSIKLQGLSPPPRNWSPRCGILDFGNIVGTDTGKMSFQIVNQSSFAVETTIVRTACHKLIASQTSEYVDRTIAGLPVFSFRPERVVIPAGAVQEVEVIFRPDRERFQPYREDLDVLVGKTDETVRIGLCGRAWSRQMAVYPSNPLDDSFARIENIVIPPVENLLINHSNPDVRQSAQGALAALGFALPPVPPIKLVFPDPFGATADPSTYVVVDPAAAAAAAGGKGAKGGGGANGASGPPAPAGARQQTRKLTVCCAKMYDGRPGAGNGSFEVVLAAAAKASALFTVNPDKGAVNAGATASVDIVCSLPKPRGVGGLAVGSWQDFEAEVVLKGGWMPKGEPDEKRIPVVLRAFISL